MRVQAMLVKAMLVLQPDFVILPGEGPGGDGCGHQLIMNGL
jgi:hypothetical protein